MAGKNYFFAGGGTGGHIYPGIAIAEKIAELASGAKIHFFCSKREIDSTILSKTNFEYTALSAIGFSLKPKKFFSFLKHFNQSYKQAKETLSNFENPIVIGIGGFVSAAVVCAAHKLKIPVFLVNIDSVAGRANKLTQRFAKEIFVQFEKTKKSFKNKNVTVMGCPLRSSFENPNSEKCKQALGLNADKKILLVMGGSSGARSINEAVCGLLGELDGFVDKWQIVHIAGRRNLDTVQRKYKDAKIQNHVIDYYDEMADLLAAADLGIGRSGAVSIAEYAVSNLPMILMPYPHHKDMHQYLNASELVEAGGAIVVDDLADLNERVEWLGEELLPLLRDDDIREQMKLSCRNIAIKDASLRIAQRIIS